MTVKGVTTPPNPIDDGQRRITPSNKINDGGVMSGGEIKVSNIITPINVTLNIPDKLLKPLSEERKNYLWSLGTNMRNLRNTIRVKEISELTRVPIPLIWGVILVPTGGKNKPLVNKSGGICDLNYDIIKSALRKEVQRGRMSIAERKWLQADPSFVGSDINPAFDLSHTNLNVFLASMYLGQLLDSYKNNEALNVYFKSQHPSGQAQSNFSNLMAKGGMMELILDAI